MINFNDELDTIGNNFSPISKIPRYSIKKYDKNQLNTVDHFKSLPITSISSITLKKNDSSQKNIIGCINLEFKGISQLIFTPRAKKSGDNKQRNTLKNLNGNVNTLDYNLPLMSAIPTYSRKRLSFQHKWLNQFTWLSYSQLTHSAFCKVCVIFGPKYGGINRQKLRELVLHGFVKYKHAKEKFSSHEKCNYHRTQ
ncbi:unnamed protein product [Gordionus sp. m RMFG-2023]